MHLLIIFKVGSMEHIC